MMKSSLYSAEFYAEQSADSRRSAAATLPLVVRLLKPRSVVDVGCGVGTWLAEFAKLGISDFIGVDGEYVPLERLQIPAERFLPRDLTQPLDLGRTYDLAMSLEVAEHLPAESAERFVDSLTNAAPIVLFSAAVPGSGGTGHINEQWPRYWRTLFRQRRYLPVDAIRSLIWGNCEVAWWYQQNMLLYCREDALVGLPHLVPVSEERSLDVVHPALYELYSNGGLRGAFGLTLEALRRRVFG
jgi:SAM-dependent methyltransferase